MKDCTTLIHLSGGLDSVFVLWDHLINFPNDRVLVHHVNLNHFAENRSSQEAAAVQNILQELRNMDLNNFINFHSTFFYGNLPRIAVKDIQIISLFSAIILNTPEFKNISKIKFGWHKGEVNLINPIASKKQIDHRFPQNYSKIDKTQKAWRVKAMFQALEVRDVEFLFPIEEFSRKYLYENLPSQLLQHVSSCRKPINNEPCGVCKTCVEYINENLKPL